MDYFHRDVLDGAWSLIRAGDGRGALPVLEAITDEYIEAREEFEWEMMGDYGGELRDFFGEVGAARTEALLSVDDLTPREQEDYGAKLDVWWGERLRRGRHLQRGLSDRRVRPGEGVGRLPGRWTPRGVASLSRRPDRIDRHQRKYKPRPMLENLGKP